MIGFIRPFVLCAALLLFALPASAQQQAAAARQACGHDVKTLCSGVQPGGGRILQCLKAQSDKVSPACKSFLVAAAQKRQAQGAAPVAPAQ